MKSLGFRLASGSVRNIARSCSGPRHCFSQFPCCQAAHPAAMEVMYCDVLMYQFTDLLKCFQISFFCSAFLRSSGNWGAMQVGSISSSMPQAVVGQHFLDVETPALVVDLDGKQFDSLFVAIASGI